MLFAQGLHSKERSAFKDSKKWKAYCVTIHLTRTLFKLLISFSHVPRYTDLQPKATPPPHPPLANLLDENKIDLLHTGLKRVARDGEFLAAPVCAVEQLLEADPQNAHRVTTLVKLDMTELSQRFAAVYEPGMISQCTLYLHFLCFGLNNWGTTIP